MRDSLIRSLVFLSAIEIPRAGRTGPVPAAAQAMRGTQDGKRPSAHGGCLGIGRR